MISTISYNHGSATSELETEELQAAATSVVNKLHKVLETNVNKYATRPFSYMYLSVAAFKTSLVRSIFTS